MKILFTHKTQELFLFNDKYIPENPEFPVLWARALVVENPNDKKAMLVISHLHGSTQDEPEIYSMEKTACGHFNIEHIKSNGDFILNIKFNTKEIEFYQSTSYDTQPFNSTEVNHLLKEVYQGFNINDQTDEWMKTKNTKFLCN